MTGTKWDKGKHFGIGWDLRLDQRKENHLRSISLSSSAFSWNSFSFPKVYNKTPLLFQDKAHLALCICWVISRRRFNHYISYWRFCFLNRYVVRSWAFRSRARHPMVSPWWKFFNFVLFKNKNAWGLGIFLLLNILLSSSDTGWREILNYVKWTKSMHV
jgi:hypothetical protein